MNVNKATTLWWTQCLCYKPSYATLYWVPKCLCLLLCLHCLMPRLLTKKYSKIISWFSSCFVLKIRPWNLWKGILYIAFIEFTFLTFELFSRRMLLSIRLYDVPSNKTLDEIALLGGRNKHEIFHFTWSS